MNNSTNTSDSNIFQGQYLIFYVIFFILFFYCMNSFLSDMYNQKFCFHSAFYEMYEYGTDSTYTEYISDFFYCLLPIVIFFGPFLAVFNNLLNSNFEKGCLNFALVHFSINVLFPILFFIIMIISTNLENKIIFSNSHKSQDYSKVKKYEEYSFNLVYFMIIPFSLIGFIFYFSSYFLFSCDLENNKKEQKIYILSTFLFFIILNSFVSNRKSTVELGKSENLYLMLCFYLLCINVIIVILHTLILEEKPEIFFTFVLFSSSGVIIIPYAYILFFDIIETGILTYEEEIPINKNKISFYFKQTKRRSTFH